MKRLVSLFLVIILCFPIVAVYADAAAGDDIIDNISTGWFWPLQNKVKQSSGFGAKRSDNLHQGIDLPEKEGKPIYAARRGVVYKVGQKDSSMGNYVCVRHGKSGGKYIFTTYMHMTRTSAKVGATVDQNSVLGYVGHTGSTSRKVDPKTGKVIKTGDHLHFHIFKDSSKEPRSVSPSHDNWNDLRAKYIDPNAVSYSYSRSTAVQTPSKPANKTEASSSLKINITRAPSSHKKGTSFGLRGEVTSNYKIRSVTGSVVNSSGKTVLSSSDAPNSKSMNVRNSNLNNRITFNTLPSGNYTFKVTATDSKGKTVNWSRSFKVIGSKLAINLTSAPSSIRYRSSFGLRGDVSSDYRVTSVKGSVLNSSGKTVLSSSDWPNSKSMDIRRSNLNNKLAFNRLSQGSYTLRVVATDASGNTVTWSREFRVK